MPEEGHPASVIATGLIAGTLHARDVSHPWLERATEMMWARIGQLAQDGGELSGGPGGAYEMLGVLRFLQHVPDRDRAQAAFGRVGPLIIDRGLVALDPETPGEVHFPLDFAPGPCSLARAVFDEATIKANLDHLAARPSVMTAAGRSTGWPGRRPRNGSGAASSPPTPCACCAPTATCSPLSGRARNHDRGSLLPAGGQ